MVELVCCTVSTPYSRVILVQYLVLLSCLKASVRCESLRLKVLLRHYREQYITSACSSEMVCMKVWPSLRSLLDCGGRVPSRLRVWDSVQVPLVLERSVSLCVVIVVWWSVIQVCWVSVLADQSQLTDVMFPNVVCDVVYTDGQVGAKQKMLQLLAHDESLDCLITSVSFSIPPHISLGSVPKSYITKE